MCHILHKHDVMRLDISRPILVKNYFSYKISMNENMFIENYGDFSQIKKNSKISFVRETTGKQLLQEMKKEPYNFIFFTNEKENPIFVNSIKTTLPYIPNILKAATNFSFVSVSVKGSSHPFHSHGRTWNYMIYGTKKWYFNFKNQKNDGINLCRIDNNSHTSRYSCIQKSNDLLIFPDNLMHGTCNLNDFSISLGYQEGTPSTNYHTSINVFENISKYYDKLETQTYRTKDLNTLSVHRFMGKHKTTTLHYDIIYSYMIEKNTSAKNLDAGCGVGGAMMYLSSKEQSWVFNGYSLSHTQYKSFMKYKTNDRVEMYVESFDNIKEMYSNIYSIEALIHTNNLEKTINIFSKHLRLGGRLILIDDYISSKYDATDDKFVAFKKAWMGVSLVNTDDIVHVCTKNGLKLISKRDLGQEFEIKKYNYDNRKIEIRERSVHQGFFGGDLRRNLYIDNHLQYWLFVFEKV